MEFGMRGHDIEAKDLKDLSKKAKNLGINHFQFALKKSVNEFDFDKEGYKPEIAQYIKETLDGIEITVLGCYINPVDPDEVSRRNQINFFKENLHYAKDLGALMVGTETGGVGNIEGSHTEETYQVLLSTMREIIDEAEKLGVMVALEAVTHFTIYSAKMMKRIIDDLNTENLCVIFDVTNILNAEICLDYKAIYKEAFDLLGDKIKVLHLKDFVTEPEYKLVHAGEGTIDYKWLLALIKERYPNIVMMLEEVKDKDLDRVRNNLLSLM